ncbi:MAG: LysR family transcriptional regulator [Lachnospiraceae bacterium]|jgi:Transcriptional regulator|nr:LysR family transcriptional regulator [Lachnospiraceae bacterium]
MRIDHLQFLIEVARCKSISTAARKLYISQTGLSAIINSIEAELNIQIFRRTNKGTLLTPDGEQAVRLMKEILARNDELHYLCSDNSQQRQIINLGIFPSGTYALSRHLVKIWSRKHRNIHLHIYEIGYEDMHSCLNDRTASIVIGAESADFPNQFHALAARNGNICIEPLYTDRFCAMVSGHSEFAGRETIHIDDLLHKHLLVHHNYPNPQDKPIGSIIHKFKLFTVLSNMEVAKQVLVDDPDKVMIAPLFAVYQDPLAVSGKLKLLEVTGFHTALSVFMVYDSSSGLSIQENLLMQEIRDFFSGLARPF